MNSVLFVGDFRYVTMQTKLVYTVRKYWKDNEFCIWMIFILLILTPFIAMSLLFRSEWRAGIILKSANLLAYIRPAQEVQHVTPLYRTGMKRQLRCFWTVIRCHSKSESFLGKALVCTIWTLSQLAENEWDWITEGCIAYKSIPSDTPFNKFCTTYFANVEQWMVLCGVCQTLG